MFASTIQFALLASATATLASSVLADRNVCGEGLTVCAPPGASSATTPQISDREFQQLFVDIVSSSLPPFKSKRSLDIDLEKRATPPLCCVSTLSCLTMANLKIPFCYDRFTTNYFLPDNSYGTVSFGTYNSSTGDTANLETGDYTLSSGQKGNIYSSNSAAKPNTATLPIPSQFTASGIGSAIPASGLGGGATRTITTTIPGSTVSATTQMASLSTVDGSRVETKTILATTIQATTVSPSVSTIVTTEGGVAAATSGSRTGAAPSASPKGNGVGGRRGGDIVLPFVLLVPALVMLL